MQPEHQPNAPAVERNLLFRSRLVEIRDNGCNRSDPALSRETAPMPYHEIVFGRVGLWCRHHRRHQLPVDARHVHFFTRGESYRVSHPAGCGDRNTGLAVEPRTLAAIARQAHGAATTAAPFATTHCAIGPKTTAAHRLLLAAIRKARMGTVEPLAVEEVMIRLAARVLDADHVGSVAREPRTRRQRELAEHARAVLHRDLATPLHLQQVADEVGCSAFHLSRIFTAATGASLMKYRASLRIARAIALTLDTDLALADIAAATGFADRSHLSRAVRRGLGQAPTELRRNAAQLELMRRLLREPS